MCCCLGVKKKKKSFFWLYYKECAVCLESWVTLFRSYNAVKLSTECK